MPSDFATIIEAVQNMSTNDKKELKFLLEKYIIDEKREEIYKNFKASQKELQENKLDFSSDMNELKRQSSLPV